jgi:hypothetical protein
MLFRLTPARIVLVLVSTSLLAGCFQAQTKVAQPTDSSPAVRSAAPSRPQAPPDDPSTELRIPGQAVTQNKEIPVVPVPPIPLGQGGDQRTTLPPLPEVRPVAAIQPPLPDGQPAQPPTQPAQPAQPPMQPAPIPNLAPSNPMETGDLKQVIHETNAAYAQLDSYIARLTRREQINGKNMPEEVIKFMFRKQPWSLHFTWIGTEGHGREVVYVKGQYEGKIHTLLAAGDSVFMPAGKRMSLAPDSPLVMAKCRYPITEAGIGASIDRITAILAANERGDKTHGTLTDLGVQKRPDYEGTLRIIEHKFPPNAEPVMPNGGKRIYGFDTTSKLPVLLLCFDNKGQEVEYYRYDRIMAVKLDNADFNPDNMGVTLKQPEKP